MAQGNPENDEATQQVLAILREARRPLSTREIQAETQKRLVRCPDATIVFLNRLRQRGVIHGERSKELRGWVWWVD
jgi:repressor of nif and glnA expression